MRKPALYILLALALVLAACAPVVSGSSARQPLLLPGPERVEVHPGEGVFLLSIRSPAELGFRDVQLDGLQWRPDARQRSSARSSRRLDPAPFRVPAHWRPESSPRGSAPISHRLNLEPGRVPAHWQVSTASPRAVRQAGQQSLEVVLQVAVPASAGLGPADLRVSLEGRRNTAQLTIPLRVRQQLR